MLQTIQSHAKRHRHNGQSGWLDAESPPTHVCPPLSYMAHMPTWQMFYICIVETCGFPIYTNGLWQIKTNGLSPQRCSIISVRHYDQHLLLR